MTGHCFCGFIRYEAEGDVFDETCCHCTTCRRVSGAPVVAWMTVQRDRFRIVAGEPASFGSSDHGTRTFCPHCGTPITFQSTHFPDEIDVTICSLDESERVPPKDHSFTKSQLPWLALGDHLPRFPERRPR